MLKFFSVLFLIFTSMASAKDLDEVALLDVLKGHSLCRNEADNFNFCVAEYLQDSLVISSSLCPRDFGYFREAEILCKKNFSDGYYASPDVSSDFVVRFTIRNLAEDERVFD